MSELFPPRSTRKLEVEQFVNVLACAIEGRSAAYLSAPITSGERFALWRSGTNTPVGSDDPRYVAEHHTNVITPNRAAAGSVVARLRQELGCVIIDPTAIESVPNWGQDEYRFFWGNVIRRYVSAVVFMDGWPLSSGCVYEFLVAVRTGAKTLSQDLRPVTIDAGAAALEAAIRRLRELGVPTTFHQAVLADLLRNGKGPDVFAADAAELPDVGKAQ